jgi:threonine dehydrogenase-like Zn-dependent dehydrogenase
MRGLTLLGDAESTVKEYPDPQPGPGEVRVAMRAAGICGSDIHMYHTPKDRIGRLRDVIIGHEPSGVVDAIGEGVTQFQVGDRVTNHHYIGCGHCQQCRAGYLQWCREAKGMGGSWQGSDADYLVVPERNVLRLPDELSFVDGALIACGAGTSYSALLKIQPSGADWLAVFGLGPIGLTGVAIAKAFGARVIAVGRRKVRLDLARHYGADVIVDIDTMDPAEELAKVGRHGVDCAYETSGSGRAVNWMLKGLRRGGRAALVAAAGDDNLYRPPLIVGKQLTLYGSFVMPIHLYRDLTRLMIEHKIRFDAMVTHRYAIEDGPKALQVMDSGECGKVIIEWE